MRRLRGGLFGLLAGVSARRATSTLDFGRNSGVHVQDGESRRGCGGTGRGREVRLTEESDFAPLRYPSNISKTIANSPKFISTGCLADLFFPPDILPALAWAIPTPMYSSVLAARSGVC